MAGDAVLLRWAAVGGGQGGGAGIGGIHAWFVAIVWNVVAPTMALSSLAQTATITEITQAFPDNYN